VGERGNGFPHGKTALRKLDWAVGGRYDSGMKAYRYCMPTEVFFGPGEVKSLGERCRDLGTKPLIVTGKHSARASGLLERVCAQFPDVAVFDAVPENPATTDCEAGAEVCVREGCDFTVALGGGSPTDAAKAIAVIARNPRPCAALIGEPVFENPPLPIVAVPTTAGTGSEVTPYAVLVDHERHCKRTLKGRTLFPVFALLDPELSCTMPRALTAATGLDALSQAMEGMVSRNSTPLGDVMAIETCRRVKTWLPRAAAAPDDIEARGKMLEAAMLSGCIIAQSGTTLVHGMGYYFTLKYGVLHGLANAFLLAPVFRHNAQHEPEKVAALAAALGHTEADPATAITNGVYGLLHELELSPAARDAGVSFEALSDFAEDICRDPYRFKNQVGTFTVDEVLDLFEAAYHGYCRT